MERLVSEMMYYVWSGTLILHTHSLAEDCVVCLHVHVFH